VPRTALLGDGPMRGSYPFPYPFPRRQRSGADEGLWRQHGRSCKERVMNRSDPRPARYRPGPLRWFWYAVGGRLPDRYRPWVLHDLTCRTWPLRHLARLVAQLAPVAIVLVLLLPGPLWIRVMGALEDRWSGCSTPSSSSTKRPRDGQPRPATPMARCTRSGTSARPSAPSGEPPPTSTAPGITSDTAGGPGTDFYTEFLHRNAVAADADAATSRGTRCLSPPGPPRSRLAASVHGAAAG
jgi:Family of unknown function (DUF5313)